MADAQRGQFVIDCKSGEAAGIIYGLVHDKTLFRPELDLANAHPKEFDNEHIFPLDMFGVPKREARRIIAKYKAQ